jgi:hypothetical protein
MVMANCSFGASDDGAGEEEDAAGYFIRHSRVQESLVLEVRTKHVIIDKRPSSKPYN